MSWAASPAELHPAGTTAAQLIALFDRVLADEDRTRRAHSFLDPVLAGVSRAVVAALIVAMVVVSLVLAGSVCLVLGLHGVGPGDGTVLARVGCAGVGLGAAVIGGGIIPVRRWWSARQSMEGTR